MDFLKKKFVAVLLLVIFLVTFTIITTRTSYIEKTNIIDKKAMNDNTSLLASSQLIANYNDVESSIKEAIDKELNAKVDEKSQEAINEKVLSVYPVGSVYISTSPTNPSEFIGGEWIAYSQGRTLIGNGRNGGYTFAAGSIGGEYEHTLTEDELPLHTHRMTSNGTVSSTFTGAGVTTSTDNGHTHTITAELERAGDHTHQFQPGGSAIVVDGNSGAMDYAYGFANGSAGARWWINCNKNISDIANAGEHAHAINGIAESIGSHTHTVTPTGTVLSTFKGALANTSIVGGSMSHNNIQPYIVTYMWKRVS